MSSEHIIGCILGTAVGDALGLPYENLSRRRGRVLFGEPDRFHFLGNRGMVSDDTEHTCMVAQALLTSCADPDKFARQLAWRLRWWLLSIPTGLGWATLIAVLKLWFGVSPKNSGYCSAGNGPAMRSAILGASIDDLDRLRELVRINSRITHTDPKAEFGAAAVALAAWCARQPKMTSKEYAQLLRSFLNSNNTEEFLNLVQQVISSVEAGDSANDFLRSQGLKRVSGYVYHTVPVALHIGMRHPQDIRAALTEAVKCGGDTDTVAAIVGGIIGTTVGKVGIPEEWLSRLWEWPRTVTWMESLGQSLAETRKSGQPCPCPRLTALGLIGRNVLFFLLLWWHVFRRCLPPL